MFLAQTRIIRSQFFRRFKIKTALRLSSAEITLKVVWKPFYARKVMLNAPTDPWTAWNCFEPISMSMKSYDVTLRYSIGSRSEHQIIVILAIFWHHIAWQWHKIIVATRLRVYRAIGVRLLAVSLRLLVPLKFSGHNRKVAARRPHGGRTFTCHHLPLLCDQTDCRQVFVQKLNFERTFTCDYYYSDRTKLIPYV